MDNDISIEKIKNTLFSSDIKFEELICLGICGSLARGDFNEKSDIDIFIVVEDNKWKKELTEIWYHRLKKILRNYHRGLTVLIYPVKGLKMIATWQVFSLASEGIILYDRGNIKELFEKIIEKTEEWGLVKKKYGRHPVWMFKDIEPGKEIELKLED